MGSRMRLPSTCLYSPLLKSEETGFTFSNLVAGNYAFNVLGFANGNIGGSYAGDMIATTVPEPETYALMLAGLGIVGFGYSSPRTTLTQSWGSRERFYQRKGGATAPPFLRHAAAKLL